MATYCDQNIGQIDLEYIDSSDEEDFEPNVDEDDAVKDLEDLLLSDDELYVELDEVGLHIDESATASAKSQLDTNAVGNMGNVRPTSTAAVLTSEGTTDLLCRKCRKRYKRQTAFEKHVENCTGKRQDLRKSVQGKRQRDEHQSLEEKLSQLDDVKIVLGIVTRKSADRALGLVKNSRGWRTQQLAKQLVEEPWNDPPLRTCAETVVRLVASSVYEIQSGSFSNRANVDAVATLMGNSCDADLLTLWVTTLKTFAPSYEDVIYNNLLQHVYDDVIPILASNFKPNESATEQGTRVMELTLAEKQVLHYAIGYTVRKLTRKYLRTKSNKASQLFLQILNKWAQHAEEAKESEESMLSTEVTSWTASQNRGGLISCSPAFYQFMKLVEIKTRVLLNSETLSQYADKNIIPVVVGELKSSSDIQTGFKDLVGYDVLNEVLCEALLDEILCSWVASKANQALRKYLFDKRANKPGQIARMGTPAMRKTIDKQ